ncbi:hypothetical protein NQ317_008324 [Molorchus minor]|uniref:Uncharacterized protein n=1 Tax=Molorchus minor TaxID=1323400 RepID=A0ABQ9JT25_9CUCU|nr:hypothetical protein NQ317_008324 [Molorchus minor]
MFLSIGNVLKYLNATPDSRNFVEGERLLNASHLILCGIEEKCEANLNIFASCLHTSAISSPPHEISGIIKNSVENGMSVTSMSCTCKAGLGGILQTYCGSSSLLHKFFRFTSLTGTVLFFLWVKVLATNNPFFTMSSSKSGSISSTCPSSSPGSKLTITMVSDHAVVPDILVADVYRQTSSPVVELSLHNSCVGLHLGFVESPKHHHAMTLLKL